MCNWLGPLLAGCLFFSIADVLCDVAISGNPHKKNDDEGVEFSPIDALDHEIQCGRYDSRQMNKGQRKSNEEPPIAFTAVHDITFSIFISIFTSLACAIWIYSEKSEEVWKNSLVTNPQHEYSILMVLLAGFFCFLSYYSNLRAYETSSCTILLPLFQVASVIVLFGSLVQKTIQNDDWIKSPLDLISYVLMVVGGLYPAAGGDLRKLTQTTFWNQGFVKLAIVGETTYGIYTILLASAESDQDSELVGVKTNREIIFRHCETFLLTRLVFVITYFGFFACSRSFRMEAVQISKASSQSMIASGMAEFAVQTAYFCSTFAYQCFYQVGVVNASETALNNLFTIIIAYALKRFLGLGKAESVKHMDVKFTAFTLIVVALLLLEH